MKRKSAEQASLLHPAETSRNHPHQPTQDQLKRPSSTLDYLNKRFINAPFSKRLLSLKQWISKRKKKHGQRSMEQKINTNVSHFANCFITTTNQYRECPVQNPIKVQRWRIPLGRAEDFSLWYLDVRLQSWFLDGSLGVWHSPCF